MTPASTTPVGANVMDPPTWTNKQEVFHIIVHPPYLKKTIRIALAVGSVIFLINHLDEVLRGEMGAVIWIKGAISCLVPFCVSNLGILVATRREGGAKRLGVKG